MGFILGLQPLHESGFRGAGKTIAVIDCGFYHANNDALYDQSKILSAHDMLDPTLQRGDMFESESDMHGAVVLSTMLYESTEFTGTAPDAHYILIRTEDVKEEYKGETENLIRGLEKADELGADIITISLGYFTFNDGIGNYTYDSLDGHTRLSQAVTGMARKGRLVCVAAGNEGNKTWHKISVPADADSILTVGAVDNNGEAAGFSGWGPSADGRVKPEVCAPGVNTTIVNPVTEEVSTGNGTSFATPEVAGMAACIWQAVPELTAMELREMIIRSASLYPSHDDQRGYGIPNAEVALQLATALIETRQDQTKARKVVENGNIVIIKNGIRYTVTGQRLK